jgi:hypothetical protein
MNRQIDNGSTAISSAFMDNTVSSCTFLCGLSSKESEAFLPSLPKWTPTVDETERMLQKDLLRFTPTERERIVHDLYGVGNLVMEESPTLVAECLEEMEYELTQISRDTAYEQALQMSPTYAQNLKFRIMFLRADFFSARRAAHRMVRFMEEKLAIFGPKLLVREITWDDLDEDDHSVLLSGCMQAATGRDRAGRLVYVGLPQLMPDPCTSFALVRLLGISFRASRLFSHVSSEDG